MREHDDTVLELKLRRALGQRLDALPFELTVAALADRRAVRVRRSATRRRWIVLGLAATLSLPAGWIAAGAPLPRPTLPSVVLESSPTTTRPGPTSAPSTSPTLAPDAAGAYEALALRWVGPSAPAPSEVDVVAVRDDGQERIVARLTAKSMPSGVDLGWIGFVSQDGQLILSDPRGGRWAIIDLRGAEPIPTGTLEGSTDGDDLAWGPDGRLAIRAARDADGRSPVVKVVDLMTHAEVLLTVPDPTSEQPLQWAADGSAVLIETGGPVRMTSRTEFGWTRLPIDGSPPESGFVPIFDDGRSRRQSVAGDRAVLCTPNIHGMRCPADGRFSIGRQDVTGAMDVWDVSPVRGKATDVVFAAADRGMWLVGNDPNAVLTRLDDHGRAIRTMQAEISSDMSTAHVGAIAPDDSLVQIAMEHLDPDITEWLLMPTNGPTGTYHVGEFAGFVRSEVGDGLGTAAFGPLGVSVPAVGHAPRLPSSRDLDTDAERQLGVTPTDPVVLRADGPTTTSPDDQTTLDLGPVHQPRGHRLAIQFACAGPGWMDVSFKDLGYGAECMADDQGGSGFKVGGPSGDRTVPLTVTVHGGVAWRIAVYDLGP